MRMPRTRGLALGGLALIALLLSGCALTNIITKPVPQKPTASAAPRAFIVASTNVYGDIARYIAGGLADVRSIITNGAQDPHSYQASAQDQLALSKADIVIQNGAGYDPFMTAMLSASGNEKAVLLTAADAFQMPIAAGNDQANGGAQPDQLIAGDNEHFWYSFAGMAALGQQIASKLADFDPANRASYDAYSQGFAAKIAGLEAKARVLLPKTRGMNAVMTEPVSMYLLEAVGLIDKTPSAFSQAIEEGADAPPAAVIKVLKLLSGGTVQLLAYNEQTAGPEAERLREAAEKAGVAIVSLTETLPDGYDYSSWMNRNLDAIATALG